jgi:flagellar M-ring protein FliF
VRQVGVLVGIAASVALGVWVILWSRTPDWTLLYASMSERDAAEVMNALQSSAIPHRLDGASGAVMVPAEQLHDARLKLAAAGLPKGHDQGFAMLDEEPGLNTSKFLESARYQRALEAELARTIAHLDNVADARVHIAAPKDTVFLRERPAPSASVYVDLRPGRALDERQVSAIVHLVAASVPGLASDAITVVDRRRGLLVSAFGSKDVLASNERLDYTRKIERDLVERIEKILSPLVGLDGVRAEVSADVDFTVVERTSESFSPDLDAVRSEQTVQEERTGAAAAAGVPGALSNEPPGVGSAPEVAGAGAGGEASAVPAPRSNRTQKTLNYELDKTISRVSQATGGLRRLSAAVVVNHKPVTDEEGTVTFEPRTEEELQRLTSLVKEAIGFDAARGDTVNVVNAEFATIPEPEPLPDAPIWKQSWIWTVAKQLLGAGFVLYVVFGIIKPAMRNLMKREPVTVFGQTATAALPAASVSAAHDPALPNPASGMHPGSALPGMAHPAAVGAAPAAVGSGSTQLAIGVIPQTDLDRVRSYVGQEPKLAAQVVRGWVGQD